MQTAMASIEIGEHFNMSHLVVSTSNNSLGRSSSSVDRLPSFKLSLYLANYFVPAMCMIIVFCDIIAVRILRRCKRVPYQCLQLSISYLLSDIVGMILFIIHEVLIFGFGVHTDIVINSRISTVALMHNISSASMTAIILERVFSLKANLKYTLALKRTNIHLVNAVLWLLHVLDTCCIISLSFYFHCNWRLSNCDITEVNRVPKYYFLSLTVLYDFIMVIANVIVYKVARRHAVQIHALKQTTFGDKMRYPDSVSERQYAAMIVFVKIVTAYLCLQTPIIITMIISTSYPDLRDQTPMQVVRSLAYLCFLTNSFVNLYLYIWKLKECKMKLYLILAKFFKQFNSRAEVLRLEVYNIVISSKSNNTDVSHN